MVADIAHLQALLHGFFQPSRPCGFLPIPNGFNDRPAPRQLRQHALLKIARQEFFNGSGQNAKRHHFHSSTADSIPKR